MLRLRNATLDDSIIYFKWANDQAVREQSFISNEIIWENHKKWFEAKVKDTTCEMYIFQDEHNNLVGQVRIEKKNVNEALIGLSIALEHRGKGYAQIMLKLAAELFLSKNTDFIINAYIKEQNLNSKNAFEKAGFAFTEMKVHEGFNSYHYIKKLEWK